MVPSVKERIRLLDSMLESHKRGIAPFAVTVKDVRVLVDACLEMEREIRTHAVANDKLISERETLRRALVNLIQ